MRRRLLALVAPAAVAALLLTGCAEQGPTGGAADGDIGEVVQQWRSGENPPVAFSGTTLDGKRFDSKAYRGRVVVVNFWYAACPPCRSEAPVLKDLAAQFAGQDVQFVGVNTRDDRDTADGFDRTFSPGYPSILDQADGSAVQLAFAGTRGPNTTPATLVLDRKGRVTARYGGLANESILKTLIQDAVDGKAA